LYGDTFNTRVLGEDQILSLDPAVFDHVMSSGFDEFHKGTFGVLHPGYRSSS
jgi:hypothetical protein